MASLTRSGPRFVLQVLGYYAIVAIALAAATMVLRAGGAWWEQGAALAAAFVSIALAQYALFQAAHHAAHAYVHRKGPRGALAAVSLFYALGFTPSFRSLHLRHHRFFGDASRDPDHPEYSRSPRSRKEFRRFLLEGVTGWAGLRRFVSVYLRPEKPAPEAVETADEAPRGTFLKLVLTQLCVLGVFILCSHPVLYFGLWVLPILTVGKTLNNLRLCAEHGFGDGAPVLRGFLRSSWSSFVIAPFGFREHVEHHLYPELDDLELQGVRPRAMPDQPEAIRRARGARIEFYEGTHVGFLIEKYRKLPSVLVEERSEVAHVG